MSTRRQTIVAVIGLGNWGASLAAALNSAALLAGRVHASHRIDPRKTNEIQRPIPGLAARILWLCVPDAVITGTTAWLVRERPDLSGQLVVHSSGVLDRSVLAAAAQAGARTASVHPMMSFPTRRIVSLAGVRFGVEAADISTRRELFRLVRKLQGHPFVIGGAGKAMYHAGAMFASPLLVAALDAGVRCMQQAGIKEKQALALLSPMAAATIANVQRQGLRRSFSGPIARGDMATLKLHREALASHPLMAHVYDSLASLAAEDLPSADGRAIRAALATGAAKDNSARKRSRKQSRR